MITRETDNKPAIYAWFAVQDARMRNIKGASHYTDSQKARAEGMKFALELVYSAREIYINYRKKFISIKVDRPLVRDRHNLTLLEKDWTALGVEKVSTPQGINYQIKNQGA